MKPTVKLKNFIGALKKNSNLFFLILLLVLFVAEVWVLRGSLLTILSPQRTKIEVNKNDTQIRVDFKNYDADISRINSGKTFVPKPADIPNPFSTGAAQQAP